jgi:hypothetical protein
LADFLFDKDGLEQVTMRMSVFLPPAAKIAVVRAGYRCERLENDSGVGDYLICPEGTAGCPEIESLRAWLKDIDTAGPVARFPRAAVRRSG